MVLGACAGKPSVSENQCTAGDWETLGYRDGANGYRSSRLLEHHDACVEHGIVPDRSEYMVGWREGIREYCEPGNGFVIGERGWAHNNVCPSELRADFVDAYGEGRQLFLARSEVNNLQRELDQKTARLTEVKSQIVNVAAQQLNGDLTPTQRIELATQVQRLYDERETLRMEIPQIEAELAVKSRELDRLAQSLAAN
jgi:hypothetical protein